MDVELKIEQSRAILRMVADAHARPGLSSEECLERAAACHASAARELDNLETAYALGAGGEQLAKTAASFDHHVEKAAWWIKLAAPNVA